MLTLYDSRLFTSLYRMASTKVGSTRIADLNKNSTFLRMRHITIVAIFIQISDPS